MEWRIKDGERERERECAKMSRREQEKDRARTMFDIYEFYKPNLRLTAY
jgi:hypothetical protein